MAKSKKRLCNKDAFRSQFDNLYKVFKKANLHFQHVDQMLPSSSTSNEQLFYIQTILLILCFAIVLIQSFGINEITELLGFQNLAQDKCLFPIKGKAKDIFVPPFECSVCANLHSVSKVKNITKKEFESK